MSFVHGNEGVSSVVGKRSRSAYIFDVPCSCEVPQILDSARPVPLRHHPARPSDGGRAAPDRGRGTTDAAEPRQAESTSGGIPAGTRSARAARVEGRAPTGAAPAVRLTPHGFPASSRHLDKPHPQTQLQRPHRHCSHPRIHHPQFLTSHLHITHTFTCGFFAVFDPKCRRSVVACCAVIGVKCKALFMTKPRAWERGALHAAEPYADVAPVDRRASAVERVGAAHIGDGSRV